VPLPGAHCAIRRAKGHPMNLPAVLELLDRDGVVRQSCRVAQWPLRVGRAPDNELVLADPHVAAHHFVLDAEADGDGVQLQVGATRNGVQFGKLLLREGETCLLPAHGEPLELHAGRSTLRLRLASHAVAAELPLAALPSAGRSRLLAAGAACVLLAGLLFDAWLAADPEGQWRALASAVIAAAGGAAVWCGLWALLSKTFTRHTYFGWHLRVFLLASIALLVSHTVPDLLAFALSWPWISDFRFVATYAVGGAALYFHLLAVEPARARMLRWMTAGGVLAGVALALWFNVQRSDRFGEELYMSHLFPPALRLAPTVSPDKFFDGVAALQPLLERKAAEPAAGGDDGETDKE
jgi:hypothetical protein